MLAFHPRFVRTFDDLPGRLSLLIHAWNGCNMRCLGCHNHEELIAARADASHLNAEQTLVRIAAANTLFDAVLLSGGEFLIGAMAEIEPFLEQVRGVFDGCVVIYSNGTYPGKLERLLARGLVDGVHLDVKLPYHLLDPSAESDLYEAILGTVPSERMRRSLLASIELVIAHDSPVSRVRTVRYPLLSDEYFETIASLVLDLKHKHRSSVPYDLNPYYAPEAL